MPRKREYEKYKAPGIQGTLFPRAIGRLDYFIRGVLVNLLLGTFAIISETAENPFLGLIAALMLIGVTIAAFWITIIPRLRDISWNTKLAWLCLIPGINIFMACVLLFTPSK